MLQHRESTRFEGIVASSASRSSMAEKMTWVLSREPTTMGPKTHYCQALEAEAQTLLLKVETLSTWPERLGPKVAAKARTADG